MSRHALDILAHKYDAALEALTRRIEALETARVTTTTSPSTPDSKVAAPPSEAAPAEVAVEAPPPAPKKRLPARKKDEPTVALTAQQIMQTARDAPPPKV